MTHIDFCLYLDVVEQELLLFETQWLSSFSNWFQMKDHHLNIQKIIFWMSYLVWLGRYYHSTVPHQSPCTGIAFLPDPIEFISWIWIQMEAHQLNIPKKSALMLLLVWFLICRDWQISFAHHIYIFIYICMLLFQTQWVSVF